MATRSESPILLQETKPLLAVGADLRTNLNILVTGLTSSGKSALVNAFLGKKHGERGAAEEGEYIEEGCTKHVLGRASTRDEQSGITIWDTPGLMDGSAKEKEYLEEIQCFWKRKNSNDLVIYCVKANTRMVDRKDNEDVKAMIMLKTKFGQDFWKNAVIVLTFANDIESIMPIWRKVKDPKERKAKFDAKIEQYEEQIHKSMIKHVGVKKKIVKRIPVVPAGHQCMRSGLLGNDWFSNLFTKCLETIPTSAGQVSASSNEIILQEDFIPAELLKLQKVYAKNGGLIGLLGGPLSLITIPLGWWTGGKYGEAEYIKQLKMTRDLKISPSSSVFIEEQEQHLKRLKDLMTDKDTIDIRCLKVFLVGPPGVGKTITLNRLLKVIDNISSSTEKYQSTLLADCIQVIAFLSKNATEWLSSRDVNEETKLVFNLVDSISAKKQVSSKPKAQDKPKQIEEPASSFKKKQPIEKLKAEESKSKQSPKLPRKPVQPQPELTKTESKAHIKAQLQKLIKTGDYSKMANLEGGTLLNINDIGGQPGFLEMLPALSTGPAMYLVFLDLSKQLDKPYEIPFSRDATIITPFKAIHTVETTISQILSAIASVHSFSRDLSAYQKAVKFREKFEKFQQVSPVATLIGTHKDQLKNPEEEVKVIDECLKKVTKRFEKILVSPRNASLFSVDNYAGTEQSDIGPIRKFMNNVFHTHFKDASLPIYPKWLIFGTVLRREYKIVKIENCLEIGKMLEMDEGEIDFCLWYLSCIGSLMRYTNIADDEDNWFKNHVICSPQVIFDSTSQLIVASLRTLHFEDYVIEEERKELIKKGQFSIGSIDKYCFCEEITAKIQREELIPAKQLIKLLNHVNLLSPITHTEKDGSKRITYLMPAVLECATQDELSAPTSPDANNPEPLFITFSCGYVPTGTFCGLITRLVSLGPHGILGIVWDLVEEGVKRNCVSFYFDFVNRVTLICHDSFYEIRVKRNNLKKSLHETCSYVLSAIFYTLNSIFEKLNPKIAFQCPCPKHASRQVIRDLCILCEGETSILFSCKREPVDTLRPTQQVWLGKLVPPGSCAKLEVLEFTKDKFSFHWTKDGSRHQIKTTGEPNVLTFQSVSEEDLGYYRCEVKEAGKVVLAVYRALHKDESTYAAEPPQPIAEPPQPIAVPTRVSQLGPLRNALWEVRAKWENIGIDLGIPMDALEAIEADRRKVERCFPALLNKWLQGDPQIKDLLKSLKGPVVDRPDLASQLEEKIKTGEIKWNKC